MDSSSPAPKPISTVPCPADQAAPLAPVRSTLADIALAVGVSAADVRAFLASCRSVPSFALGAS